MKPFAYAVEITAYDSELEATRLLTFATSGGFCSGPADTPANTYFDPSIVDPGNFSQFLVDSLVTDGASRVGYGVIVIEIFVGHVRPTTVGCPSREPDSLSPQAKCGSLRSR